MVHRVFDYLLHYRDLDQETNNTDWQQQDGRNVVQDFAKRNRDGVGLEKDLFGHKVMPMNGQVKAQQSRESSARVRQLQGRDGDVVPIETIMEIYDVSNHPKYLSGERSKRQCFFEFMAVFQEDDVAQYGDVTKMDKLPKVTHTRRYCQ